MLKTFETFSEYEEHVVEYYHLDLTDNDPPVSKCLFWNCDPFRLSHNRVNYDCNHEFISHFNFSIPRSDMRLRLQVVASSQKTY